MIEFQQGLVFAAFPAVAAVVIFASRPPRRVATTAVRLLLFLGLCAALARPYSTVVVDRPPHVVYLVDVSDSIPADDVEQALEAIPDGSDILLFAGRVEPFTNRARALHRRADEDQLREIREWKEGMRTDRTDYRRALLAARARFRDRHENHIVLFTDGRSTVGTPDRLENVTIIPMPTNPVKDVRLLSARAPLAIRTGEPFDVRVDVDSSFATNAELSLFVDAEEAATLKLDLPEGRSTVLFPSLQRKKPLKPGMRELWVHVRAKGDVETRNNQAFTAVTVGGKPKILLVEASPLEGEFLYRTLTARDMEVKRADVDGLRRASDGLGDYDAVVLVGVTADSLPGEIPARLKKYLSEEGGGLLVVSAPALEQEGKTLHGTPIEEALPVRFAKGMGAKKADDPSKKTPDPGTSGEGDPKEFLAPRIAMLLVIDKSGSMAVGTNLKLAREACLQTAEALTGKDVVGVLGFDVKPAWVAEFTPANRLEKIEDRVQRLFAGGGTDIHSALSEAARVMSHPKLQKFGIRHVVLLSDGETPPADFQTVLEKMKRKGVTVSSICIGTGDFNTMLMRRIASVGGGRFLFTNSFQNLPKLFVEETERIAKKASEKEKVENPVRDPKDKPDPGKETDSPPARKSLLVKFREAHEVLRGITEESLPPLDGAVGGTPRKTAFVPLVDDNDQPILAIWRYGLGKSAVWMSDVAGRWSNKWLAWDDAPKLFSQLVRHLSGQADVQALAGRIHIERRGPLVNIRVSGADPKERITGVALERRGEEWSGTVTLTETGTVTPLRFVWAKEDQVERFSTAVTMDYLPEFDSRYGDILTPLLPESRVGRNLTFHGRKETERRDWTLLLIAATLLFLPIDVALRRIR